MNYQAELREIREQIINAAIFGGAVLAVPALVASMLRYLEFGWHDIYFFHIGIAAALLFMILFRKRLDTGFKIHMFILLILVLSVVGLVSFELAGGGYMFLMAVVIATMLFGRKQGVIYAVVYLLIFAVMAILNSLGLLNSRVDYNVYMDNIFSWISIGVGYVLCITVFLYAVHKFYSTFTRTLAKTTDQASQLNQTLSQVSFQEERFRKFMDAFPFPVTIKDSRGTYIFTNMAAIRHSGSGEAGLQGKGSGGFYPEVARLIDESDEAVLSKNTYVRRELNGDMGDGNRRHYDVIKFPLDDVDGNKLIGSIAVDVTGLRMTEQMLLEREVTFRALFDRSADAIMLIQKSRLIDCNISLLRQLGYQKIDEIKGRQLWELSPEIQPDHSRSKEAIHLLEAQCLETGNLQFEWVFMSGDGKKRYFDVMFTAITLDNKRIIHAACRDASARKKMEQDMFQHMISVEEKERARYARELHDGLGPILSTSMIYLHTIKEEADRKTVGEHIDRTCSLIEEAMLSIREISNNLSPEILNKYGIVHAVRAFIEKLGSVSGVEFVVHSEIGERRFDGIVEFTVYRTITELINNSLKHSNARSIRIGFGGESEMLSVTYEDDGSGFDYQQTRKTSKGFGLHNLENRILKLGGLYLYRSAPGKGVYVSIQLNSQPDD